MSKKNAKLTHELKKPLSVIRGLLYRYEKIDDPKIQKTTKSIDEEIDRMVKMLNELENK